MKVLAVCLGNICRSPLAEGLLRREATDRGLDWTVDSAGTAGYHRGNPPDPRSVAIARRHGLDIADQRSRQVAAADLERFDLILALDRQNLADLQQLAGSEAQRRKVHLLLTYAGLEEEEGPDVFDPYYDDGAYAGVYEQLERAARRIADRVVRETSR